MMVHASQKATAPEFPVTSVELLSAEDSMTSFEKQTKDCHFFDGNSTSAVLQKSKKSAAATELLLGGHRRVTDVLRMLPHFDSGVLTAFEQDELGIGKTHSPVSH
jgi:hypothetical protein